VPHVKRKALYHRKVVAILFSALFDEVFEGIPARSSGEELASGGYTTKAGASWKSIARMDIVFGSMAAVELVRPPARQQACCHR
jgi:hypothetical protein